MKVSTKKGVQVFQDTYYVLVVKSDNKDMTYRWVYNSKGKQIIKAPGVMTHTYNPSTLLGEACSS